jgi:CBS domain-containing protein
MSPLVFTLHPEDDVADAAALMAYEGVHHVVVSLGDDRPLGIVSSLDVLRWLAQSRLSEREQVERDAG